ncbi:Ig-like domain-containing protein [Paraglaciecola chathamensis]|jgi:uncharacterized protein YjdB|uniref:Ig-like protein, group 2 n=1 Tax=Paraglaciecola chathamensis S18K6 TaxID=1127672 RepID=A0AAV3UTI2_9ALTE|nr:MULTISPECIES: Ig-like domain-containing protein [Paraglaciecola]MBN25516.1 Ig-like protein, group 2 [Alteromonadaceae bacterium]GAC08431.1 Ig-like protein, group 2 [Paraglaciecola chathamensis S18K6]|tara:strand:- start:21279 stop:22979 length:1701 start_codon:yes stop_codon:yes gene_type:complete
MYTNLLKKCSLGLAVSLALTACGEGDGTQKLFGDDVPAPQVAQSNPTLTFDEGEVVTVDLTEGVTNPADTPIFIRKLTYLEKVIDEFGNEIPGPDGLVQNLFVGPPLPNRAVTAIENELTFDGTAFEDVLVHPYTVEQRDALIEQINTQNSEIEASNNADDDISNDEPLITVPPELYSQGIYRFTYSVDNGADTQPEVELTITVNGVEVKPEAINLISDANVEVAKGYTAQINANLTPANTTYINPVFTSLDPQVASVSAQGLITGVELGTFTILVASQDGALTTEVTGEVVPLTDPTGIAIIDDDTAEEPNTLATVEVQLDTPLDLDYLLLPDTDEVEFTSNVLWTSSDTEKLTVDEDGLVTPLMYNNAVDMQEDNKVIVTATIEDTNLTYNTEVTIVPGTNLMAAGKREFSSDDALGEDFLFARTDAGQVNLGIIELRDDANSIDGQSLYVNSMGGNGVKAQFSPKAFAHAGVDTSVAHEVSFDVRVIQGSAIQVYFQSPGVINWQTTVLNVTPEQVANGEVVRFTHRFNSPGESRNDGSFYFNFHVEPSVEAYIDNLSYENVE